MIIWYVTCIKSLKDRVVANIKINKNNCIGETMHKLGVEQFTNRSRC